MAKKKKLTPKEQLFCITYCSNGFNGTQAAIKAGYSKRAAAEIAYGNIRKHHIKEEIERLKGDFESLMSEFGITKAKVLQMQWEIASNSISQLHNTWIERKEFEKLTPQQQACIEEIDTKVEYKKDPEGFKGKKKVEYIRIKIYSKADALKEVSKLMGFYATEKKELEFTGLTLNVTKDQKNLIDKLD